MAAIGPRNWSPGSFTKNFSWGDPTNGLAHLHDAINIGFGKTAVEVERDTFRARIRRAGYDTYIPPNFFLFNRIDGGRTIVLVDELVRTALTESHDRKFDHLAVLALHLSLVGSWRGARPGQRYPAEWAKHFIVSAVFSSGRWNTSLLNAAEIRDFISSHPHYRGVWANKAATNLNYIYDLSGIKKFVSGLAEDWWGSAVFLALDRIANDRGLVKPWPATDPLLDLLTDEHFFELTAVPTAEGRIAARELVELYVELDGPNRPMSGVASLPSSTAPVALPTSATAAEEEKRILPVERVFETASRQVRDRKIVSEIRRLYRDECVVCGTSLPMAGAGNTYSEVGHVKPVGFPINGPDHIGNVLPFCPNHHRQFDKGAIYFEVIGGSATLIDRSHRPSLPARTFTPAVGHAFDMSNLKWHADFFLQR